MAWILFTLLAAFMQAWRNAFQSQLNLDVKVAGVTLARFIWASPIAALYLMGLYWWQPVDDALTIDDFTGDFWSYVIGASLMQILATGLMVQLFKMRDFAIGAGLAKSEAIVAAILGVLFFGTHLSLLGWLGVTIGAVAVFMMSTHQGIKNLSPATMLIGLSCGSAFALTSLWIREASLCLTLPFPHRAAWVLLWVISIQTLLLTLYLLIRDRETLLALWHRPRLTLLISVSSCFGSIGWFSAMSLQAVPYVKTLGQIEIFFTIMIAALFLKQQIKVKDMLALVLIAVAAGLVMWG